MPHFGLALSVPEFRELAARVAAAGIRCELGPRLRFEGQPGEQWTMFFRDPSGNALEFKAMTKPVRGGGFFFSRFFFFFLRFLKGERAREDESSRSPSSSLATLFRKKQKQENLFARYTVSS